MSPERLPQKPKRPVVNKANFTAADFINRDGRYTMPNGIPVQDADFYFRAVDRAEDAREQEERKRKMAELEGINTRELDKIMRKKGLY